MGSVLWFYGDNPKEWNTSEVRVIQPAEALSRAGYSCKVAYIGELIIPALTGKNVSPDLLKIADESDVIVLERLLVKPVHEYIKKWRAAGKRVVATFDDCYDLIPRSGGVSYFSWTDTPRPKTALDNLAAEHGYDLKKLDFSDILEEFHEGLRLVDTALVPSRLLADDYRKYCPSIQYIPNFPDVSKWEGVKANLDTNRIVIGWYGTSAHAESIKGSGIAPALGSICAQYRNVSVTIIGNSLPVNAELSKYGVRYNIMNWMPMNTNWRRMLGLFTIGVCPLAGNYDLRRSFLKASEMSMAGLPWVASDLAPYQDARGGLKVDNRPSAWINALKRMIESPELRHKYADEGHAWALDLADQCLPTYTKALGLV